MAKGQLRGNREIRKPKKDKSVTTEAPSNSLAGRLVTQIKDNAKPKK